jgi:MazG family protein
MDELFAIADKLLGPEGCPWDREQTLFTLQPYLLEETHELIEAIDLEDLEKVKEELGDVLYALVFIAKLSSENFSFSDAVRGVCEKLIRRHPHVFGDQKISSTEDIVKNWEEVKKAEGKKSPIDNIPPTLPALARAQKVIHKLKRNTEIKEKVADDLGQKLWDLVYEADRLGVDAESALRRTCLAYEEKHRR